MVAQTPRNIRIGDVSISFSGDFQPHPRGNAQIYRAFADSGKKTDVRLRFHPGIPPSPLGDRVFDCSPMWAFYQKDSLSAFEIFTRSGAPGLRRFLVFGPRLEEAGLYFIERSPCDLDPFHGPTMELLMVTYLTKVHGGILHAVGMATGEKGVAFVGQSGAGKSTLAHLWDEERAVEILSDDRIILRKKGSHFWMYGTPWHGDAEFASPRGVRLERIYFLKQGRENRIRDMGRGGLVSRLLTCAFPPHWNVEGMTHTLEMLAELTAAVPCHELTFRPDRSALDFLRQNAR